MLSAILLEQINGIAAYVTNDALARAVVFGFVTLVLLTRPEGLFTMPGRRARLELLYYALFITFILAAPWP